MTDATLVVRPSASARPQTPVATVAVASPAMTLAQARPSAGPSAFASSGDERPDELLPQVPHAGWVTATAAFLTLAVGLPVFFAGLKASSFRDPVLSLSMFVTIYAAARLAGLLHNGRDALLRLTFWIYVYLWLGLAASAQIIANRFPIPYQSFDSDLQAKAMIGVVAGIVAYDLGGVFARRSSRSSWLGRSLSRFELAPRRVWLVAAVGVVYPLYITAKFGLAVRFSSRETATNAIFRPGAGQRVDLLQDKAAGLVQVALLWVPAFLALYLMIYLYRSHRPGDPMSAADQRWSTSLRARRLIGILVLVNVLANNPQSNPRYRFAGIAIALVITFWPSGGMARFRLGALALLGLTIVVFPYAAVFRYDQRALTFTPLSEQLATSPDYGMFQQQLNGLVYTRDQGHTLGRQLEGAVLSPVPRVLWPTKPLDTGNVVSRTNIINASSDFWTEANVDFGMAGIGVWFFLYGYVSRVFEDAYRDRNQRRATVIGAAVPLFAAFQIFLVRGALQPAIGELLPVAGLFVCCLRRVRTDA